MTNLIKSIQTRNCSKQHSYGILHSRASTLKRHTELTSDALQELLQSTSQAQWSHRKPHHLQFTLPHLQIINRKKKQHTPYSIHWLVTTFGAGLKAWCSAPNTHCDLSDYQPPSPEHSTFSAKGQQKWEQIFREASNTNSK